MVKVAGNLKELIDSGAARYISLNEYKFKSTVPGPAGPDGPRGPQGVGVHHMKGTSTTDSEGDFSTAGELDTYTFYADANEEFPLAWFTVKNGEDPYLRAVDRGYRGTEEEFYVMLGSMEEYATIALESIDITEENKQFIIEQVQIVASDKLIVEQNMNTTISNREQTDLVLELINSILLGSKAEDPLVDNNGDTLTIGSMYFNTVENTLKVWSGIKWFALTFTFNGRAGEVVLLNSDVTSAVGRDVADALNTIDLALANEVSKTNSHIANISNPHNVTKAQVGLGNVNNTSDINKPISTATQTALNLKVDKVAGKQLSTEDYTTADKNKLTGLSNYTKPVSEPISYITGLQTALDSKVNKNGVEALHSTDALRISGTTLSLYKGDGTFDSITTQDTVYTLPTATSTVKGGIEIFSDTVQTTAANAVSTTGGRTYGVQLNSVGQAVVNVPWSDTNTVYTLPNASATVLGGIKVGTNLSIDANGVLSANDTNVGFAEISDKPTNLSGYGITDAYTKTEVDSLIPDISTKQDTLVSATNIKTINGQSVLGSGDIVISGGAVDLSEYYKKTETYSKVEVDTIISNIPETDLTNYYNKTEVDSLIDAIPEADLTNYYNKTEVDTMIGDIASALDTINGQVI